MSDIRSHPAADFLIPAIGKASLLADYAALKTMQGDEYLESSETSEGVFALVESLKEDLRQISNIY